VDALGNPVGFHLTGGQEHDLAGADALLPELEAEALIADKAFDADQRVLEPLAEAGKTAVIPPRKSRTTPRAFDRHLYKGNYSPPHRDAFLLLNQQLTPISSRCRVESNCRRDVSRAASCDATLVVSSGTLLV